jgi:hypothetical protein
MEQETIYRILMTVVYWNYYERHLVQSTLLIIIIIIIIICHNEFIEGNEILVSTSGLGKT